MNCGRIVEINFVVDIFRTETAFFAAYELLHLKPLIDVYLDDVIVVHANYKVVSRRKS